MNTNDDSFFKCIQKAHETLNNFERRRQFDSADPELLEELEEETPTSLKAAVAAKGFIETFGPVFEREARFSKKEPVPQLGGLDASKEHVEGFYDFWYNFDSWRSFEWYDKEVNEGSDNRDDKRYTEKKNKSERARRKKEDNTRLRSLVDLTLGLDPRIKRIKQEEKAAREAKKAARSGAGSGASTPAAAPVKSKAQEEAEKKAKEEEEKVWLSTIQLQGLYLSHLQAQREDSKKAKAAAANAAKKARRAERAAAEAAGTA